MDEERVNIENQYGLTYHQGVGELIYGMVTCRPGISFLLIQLSQDSTKPTAAHVEAMQ